MTEKYQIRIGGTPAVPTGGERETVVHEDKYRVKLPAGAQESGDVVIQDEAVIEQSFSGASQASSQEKPAPGQEKKEPFVSAAIGDGAKGEGEGETVIDKSGTYIFTNLTGAIGDGASVTKK